MRRLLAAATLLLLTSCGGGTSRTADPLQQPVTQQPAGSRTAGALKLDLQVQPEGSRWRLNLVAPDASDLYQIAGSLEVSLVSLSIAGVEAGGGLGGPEDSYFLSSTAKPGRIDFAYTKRSFGPGASGQVNLVSVILETTGEPVTAAEIEAAVSLPAGPDRLRARDSQREGFVPEVLP